MKVLTQLCIEESNIEMSDELEKDLIDLERKIEEFKLEILLNGPYDKNNAILSIHAGAGGTEAQDWAEMLLRMYTRWAAKRLQG